MRVRARSTTAESHCVTMGRIVDIKGRSLRGVAFEVLFACVYMQMKGVLGRAQLVLVLV